MSAEPRYFTVAEWTALIEAVALQEATWQQDGDENGVGSESALKRTRALDRAFRKAHQLVPPTGYKRRKRR